MSGVSDKVSWVRWQQLCWVCDHVKKCFVNLKTIREFLKPSYLWRLKGHFSEFSAGRYLLRHSHSGTCSMIKAFICQPFVAIVKLLRILSVSGQLLLHSEQWKLRSMQIFSCWSQASSHLQDRSGIASCRQKGQVSFTVGEWAGSTCQPPLKSGQVCTFPLNMTVGTQDQVELSRYISSLYYMY